MNQIELVGRVLDLIEERLDENPSVQDIAEQTPLSSWHFQRVFRAVVGETLGGYVRRRRLSRSVSLLLDTDSKIIDIAIQSGFESQEAYTRAFRAQFGLPPGRFRARGQRPDRATVAHLTSDRLQHASAMSRSTPSVVHKEAARYVGLGCHFISALADDSDNMRVIPELWQTWARRRREVQGAQTSSNYGVTCFLSAEERVRPDELSYLAGARVDRQTDSPLGMESRETTASLYAVFEHPGPQSLIPETIIHALLTWLPESGFYFGAAAEVECVPTDGRAIEFWLPIRERPPG